MPSSTTLAVIAAKLNTLGQTLVKPSVYFIRPETARALRDIALARPGVSDVGRVLSMYLGPDDELVTMDLDFDAGTETADAALAMAEVRRRVRARFPMIKRLFIESGSAAVPQRWSRPDAIRPMPEANAAPDPAVVVPAAS